MTAGVQKHEKTIEECVTRLLDGANDARGLRVEDLLPRVAAVVQKTFGDAPEQSEIKIFIEALHIDDLCLVLACERNNDKAWEYLFQNFGSTVRAAARKITKHNEDAEDLANSIWAELYGLKIRADGKSSGKLGYYSGRGSLAGWLRAVVAQLAIDAHRKISRLVQIEEDREFENLAHEADKNETFKFHSTNENPEKSLTDKRGSADVEMSLKTAIAGLADEDRLLMKLYYFDDLNLKQAGAILGFHEATASRRVVKIQTNLRKRVEQILETERGWQPDEIRRTLSNTASILQTDVENLLRAEQTLQENPTSGVPKMPAQKNRKK